MRTTFDEELKMLHDDVFNMGAKCEDAIKLVLIALTAGKKESIKEIETLENDINEAERNIQSLCLKLLLQQQPVASDLRMISSALKIITDMERIGDQALDIAELITYITGHSDEKYEKINEMGRVVAKMVRDSVDAFVEGNEELANKVIACDDEADEDFNSIKRGLIEIISAKPADGEYALDVLMVAKYLERIGDHAVNIARWVKFSITGKK